VPLSDATAIASGPNGVVVASGQSIETLRIDLSVASSVSLRWPGSAPGGEAAALGLSPRGRIGLAVNDAGGVSYATAGGDGRVTDVTPAATPPFTPLIGWLDESRMVVLSTDDRQVSRLAVGNSPAELTPLTALSGCRWFAVSGDGGTIAASTESGVFAGPSSSWVSGQAPAQVALIADGNVAWDLALDRSGTRLAFLTGRVADDGTVTQIHELAFAYRSGTWQQTEDVAVPFVKVRGQAWAG
jgi:hypothetical protein